MKTNTVCLYTRKHPEGGHREKYLAATNENCARKFAIIDGERWTNRGLVTGDPGISKAEHGIRQRLDYLRGEIEAERISYGEISELQDLAPHIAPDDTLLLEWAGVPETV